MKNTKIFITKALSIGFLLLLSFSQVFSQTKTITGKVTDVKDGSPVVGATVQPKGSKNGTSTGADGSFSITVGANVTTLVVTSIGFDKQEINVSASTTANVTLASSNANLNEVVVVGYGTARRKDLTGSVASIKAKDFNQGVVAAPDQLLQNKVAGLEVTNTSGQPGVATTIQIRGNSSIRSSNNPLFVVDGVPLDGSSARPNLGVGFGSTPNSNPLLYIDPNSIASIDVLKDASSAAIYGARGANGVIVITTKKASSGPMKVDVGASFGINAGYMKRFEVLNAGEYRAALKKYGQPASLDGGTSEDALKALTQHGFSQNYSVAFSGGNEVGKFRAAFLGSKQDGFLKKTGLNKYLTTIGGTYKFLENKLTLDFNLIAGNYGEQLTSVSNTAGSAGNIISSALSWNPTIALKSNGLYVFPSNGSGNPLAFNDAYNDRSSVNSFLANVSASYKIINHLTYKFLYGVNHGTGTRKQSIDGWLEGQSGISGVGIAGISDAKLLSQTFSHTLDYNTDLGKNLTLDAIAGYEYFKTDFSGDGVVGSGFNTNLTQATRTNIPYTSTFQDAKTIGTPYYTYVNPTAEIQSYFGRVTLNYMDKFIVNGSLRADGSSKFGKNNKYGYFPAIGARWVISNENFMKDSRVFANLALRASYGITGNQEFPAGSSQEQFSLSSYNTAPQVINGNPDLKWESSKSVNIGTDFALLGGKIFVSVDYYHKNTSDILFQTTAIQPAPSSLSFVNLKDANLINSGVEVAVGATIIDRKTLGWEISANAAYNKNNVKNFKDPNTGLDLLVQTGQINGQGVSGTLAQVITNNHPVNEYYLKQFGGFDQSGNQIIAANPGFAGDPNPHWLAGFSSTLRYKKLSLNINMGGAFGFMIYNNSATAVTNLAGIASGRNIDKAAYESPEGVKSAVGASTRFLENGNYFKMRNATVKYNVGNLGKYIRSMTAFVTGTNLFVITKFTGFDPEVNIDKSNNSYPSRSIEYVPYPTPRIISFGVNFSLY